MRRIIAVVVVGVLPLAVVGLSREKQLTVLSPCEDMLFQNVGDIHMFKKLDYNRRYDSCRVAKDLFLILDTEKNELFLYTPRFAGRVGLEKDIQGNPILRMVKDKPRDPKKTKELNERVKQALKNSGFKYPEGVDARDAGEAGKEYPQYNIRIPYWPNGKGGPGAGFFYVTINGMPPGGWMKGVRFLSGPAESKPDFSRKEETGPVQIIAEREEPREYFALSVEEDLWVETTQGLFSDEAKAMLVRDMVARVNSLDLGMHRKLYIEQHGVAFKGYRFENLMPSDEEARARVQARYAEILDVCREGAEAAGEKELLKVVKSQPEKISFGERDGHVPW